jgi:non-specific serine/threonine protein kinase
MNKAVELPNSLPIGTRVAEFEIREVIGEGGFGIVYLAFDHSLQRTVAPTIR